MKPMIHINWHPHGEGTYVIVCQNIIYLNPLDIGEWFFSDLTVTSSCTAVPRYVYKAVVTDFFFGIFIAVKLVENTVVKHLLCGALNESAVHGSVSYTVF